jgi:ligand-binding SRPBCC domain-containing protein
VTFERTFSSRLSAPPAAVWDWITSFDGIGLEMAPYLSMSCPPGIDRIRPEDVVPGRRLFRSTIRLFALLPIDYSDLTLVGIEPGVGFVEQSPMGSMRRWRHARRIEPDGAGSVLVDELTFEPRFGGRAAARVIEFFFNHRHRNLRRHLGE